MKAVIYMRIGNPEQAEAVTGKIRGDSTGSICADNDVPSLQEFLQKARAYDRVFAYHMPLAVTVSAGCGKPDRSAKGFKDNSLCGVWEMSEITGSNGGCCGDFKSKNEKSCDNNLTHAGYGLICVKNSLLR